jgi:antitoxin CptB
MTANETRMKRALYRAHHRGTKEMDLVLGGFADACLAPLDEAGLGAFEELLALPEPEIDRLIKGAKARPGLASIIARIRRHHRLES